MIRYRTFLKIIKAKIQRNMGKFKVRVEEINTCNYGDEN